MKKHLIVGTALGLLVLAGLSIEAHARDQIIHPYQGVRSSAMGGVRYTTGLYDENFFSNPARVVANPSFRFTLLDPSFEINSSSINTASDLIDSKEPLKQIATTAGNNNHIRFQTTLPSVYIPAGDGKWAFALGLITSIQADVNLHKNFSISPEGFADIGPAFTVGRKLLSDERLAVGVTTHLTYRISTRSEMSLADLLRNDSLAPRDIGGNGAMVDFDLGATYDLPFSWNDFNFSTGLAINNLLDGKYSNIKIDPIKAGRLPAPQPRSLGFGMAAKRAALGPFDRAVFALEFSDIGNNKDGSLFRTVHLGGEVNYGILAPRLGISQGYWTAGVGLNLRFFTLEYATYGEEMSLNVGAFEDRRHMLKLAFQLQGASKSVSPIRPSAAPAPAVAPPANEPPPAPAASPKPAEKPAKAEKPAEPATPPPSEPAPAPAR